MKDKVRAYHDFHTQSINNGNISQEDKDFLTTRVADAPAKVSANETAAMPKMTAKTAMRALQEQGYSLHPMLCCIAGKLKNHSVEWRLKLKLALGRKIVYT